jgi:hypothetical protein
MFGNYRGSPGFPPFNNGTDTARGYLAVRWEGSNSTSGTPGSSNSIWELYMFFNGLCELRIGNWTNDNGISGVYSSSGSGSSFTSPASGNSYVFPRHYNYANSHYMRYNHVYENGIVVAKANASDRYPLLGAGPIASASWPPSGWTSLVSSSTDDASVSLSGASASVPAVGGSTGSIYENGSWLSVSSIYVGSNGYVLFGGASSNYSSLSASNPAYDKIMIDAADRSYQQVAWKVGSK